jgi:hypothetical protein
VCGRLVLSSVSMLVLENYEILAIKSGLRDLIATRDDVSFYLVGHDAFPSESSHSMSWAGLLPQTVGSKLVGPIHTE